MSVRGVRSELAGSAESAAGQDQRPSCGDICSQNGSDRPGRQHRRWNLRAAVISGIGGFSRQRVRDCGVGSGSGISGSGSGGRQRLQRHRFSGSVWRAEFCGRIGGGRDRLQADSGRQIGSGNGVGGSGSGFGGSGGGRFGCGSGVGGSGRHRNGRAAPIGDGGPTYACARGRGSRAEGSGRACFGREERFEFLQLLSHPREEEEDEGTPVEEVAGRALLRPGLCHRLRDRAGFLRVEGLRGGGCGGLRGRTCGGRRGSLPRV